MTTAEKRLEDLYDRRGEIIRTLNAMGDKARGLQSYQDRLRALMTITKQIDREEGREVR